MRPKKEVVKTSVSGCCFVFFRHIKAVLRGVGGGGLEKKCCIGDKTAPPRPQ
jgi:hypothetical protein